MPTKADTFLKV